MVTVTPELDMENDFEPEPEPELRELTKLDRCDACGAQAFVIAFKCIAKDGQAKTVELLFCAHHFKYGTGPKGTVKDMLDAESFLVVDYSDQLNTKPSVSANAD